MSQGSPARRPPAGLRAEADLRVTSADGAAG